MTEGEAQFPGETRLIRDYAKTNRPLSKSPENPNLFPSSSNKDRGVGFLIIIVTEGE